MSQTYLAIGMKNGDVCVILPILYQVFLETKQKPVLITSKKVESLLAGIGYVTPDYWSGDWQDLRGAYRYAKKKYGDVVCLSTFGKDWPVHKKTPSFQLDQWERAGRLSQFGSLPLVFDQRSPERESDLVSKHTKDCQPFILFADHSESSPFEHKEDLAKLLEEKFGVFHKILRLSTVQAERPCDLIGLYDRAAALVSIDTMHLHLSAASKVPVIALASDVPEYWRGTAWQRRFNLHIRYGDYQARKQEIVRELSGIINQTSKPEVKIIPTDIPNGYNPSIIEFEGRELISCRHHPDRTFWRTELAIIEDGKSYPIKSPEDFKEYSIEDGRLFVHKGKLHISYVVSCAPKNEHRCVIQYGELVRDADGWKIINNFQPMWGRNDFSALEKNWQFWSHQDKLYFSYAIAPEHIVLEVERDIVMNEHRTKTPDCPFGVPRGGTQPLEHNGLWLRFFHTQQTRNGNRNSARYCTGALLMEKEPPFSIVAVGKHPVISGDERYFPRWKFWKWNVSIPYGAIKRAEKFLVSVGINDSACGLLELTEKDLNL